MDCDGVPDEVEETYGSDQQDPESTPEGLDYDSFYDEVTCEDGLDNDKDLLTDAMDPDCLNTAGA